MGLDGVGSVKLEFISAPKCLSLRYEQVSYNESEEDNEIGTH